MESILIVAVFWLSVLSVSLGWKVLMLRRTVRMLADWQRAAAAALESVYLRRAPQEDDDAILDSEVIQ